MSDVVDKMTRFAADLVDSAAVEGARQSRSGKQQLDHWARVGRAVSEHPSVARRRVEAVFAGQLPLSALDEHEQVVANAEIDAAIQERLRGTNYGERLISSGVSIVALDKSGSIVRYNADGSTTPVETHAASATP